MRVFLVALFIALVPQLAAADPPSQYRKEWQARQDAAAQDQNRKPMESFHPNFIDWLSAKLGVTGCGPYAVDRLGRAENKSESEYNDSCDLDAQESVANSTRWLLLIALLQTVLGILGAYLVWKTLRYNREATKAAIYSSTLAEKAIEHAATASRLELRAYLLLEFSRVHIDEHGLGGVILTFKNTGQTPAVDVIIAASMEVVVGGGVPEFAFVFDPTTASKFSVSAGGHREKKVGPVPQDVVAALQSGEREMRIWGEARYSDIFGQSHWSRFRLIGGSGYGFAQDQALTVTPTGNEEDKDDQQPG